MNQKNKNGAKSSIFLRVLSYCIIAIMLFALISFVGYTAKEHSTVGVISESKLCYKNEYYVESFEDIDIKVVSYLGKVRWEGEHSESRLYRLKGEPDYLYVSLGFDHRIYKLISSE